MTYFYWFILQVSADNPDNITKPSMDSFSPISKRFQYLERSRRWSVQIQSKVPPSEAIDLYYGLTAISRSWINGAVVINGEAVGGPWDAETFPTFVAGYAPTYAHEDLALLRQ